ncbi:GTP-binding protein [Butyrivibrio sp. MB2005]|uniref:GTP-binding protein n=1 Tax=Butyrivibrio sp. MB2005 TaxID=1280678 RepID=UPI000404D508|nr:GTP-binding protein [Butyrivibrio sp. MB2005]
MNILIVSGFLGAGKTTFIKELIRRTGTTPVVLENEYGDNSIDAKELRSTDTSEKKLEIMEFMEGCVCCTMKDSFVNSVLTIFSGLSPEYLIVEPTGVGRLSSIISNLQPILHGNISILNPIVVLSPRSSRQNMSQWKELYTDQIANAGIVIFSKCENDSPDLLSETENAVRSINPTARIISTHYTAQEESWWKSIMALPGEEVTATESSDEQTSFSQITINDAKLTNPGELITLLEDCLRGELGHIARAKGTIPVGSETLRFDLADGLYSIADSPQSENQCVFIGEALDKAGICRRVGSRLLSKPASLSISDIKRKSGKQLKVTHF